jgi:D-glycero-D-manno-heptose 1,7-bisphosphate phosphatase
MKMRKRLLLLDLDGTVRKPIEGEWVKGHNQQLIPGVKCSIQKAKKTGWVPIGVTNQAGVHYGHKTLGECTKEQRYTMRLAGLFAVFFCPDLGTTCQLVYPKIFGMVPIANDVLESEHQIFRKPSCGMLLAAVDYFAQHYYPELVDGMLPMSANELVRQNSFEIVMVGDRTEDKEAAETGGINFLSEKQFHRFGIPWD